MSTKTKQLRNNHEVVKSVFFSESEICFLNLQISQNIYSKSPSWVWNLNKLFTVMGGNSNFQVQDSDLEYLIHFRDLEIRKTNLTFWKKDTFSVYYI